MRPEVDAEAVSPQSLADTVPLGDAAVASAAPDGADTGDREGARRRRRRGGRGRNRGDGAPGSDLQNGVDEGVAEEGAEAADESTAMVGDVHAAEAVVSPSAEPAREAEPTPDPAPVAARPKAIAPPAPEPIVVPRVATRAEPYALPIDALNEVASAAGLEWVHSDGEKVRAAQAAMAAEVAAPRVPRQPKPPVALDDGPLILVETKKDLSQIRLPFDSH
ncbi:MAG TPA: hypothetical protein VM845_11320 [Burkholderiaceae bacterium]|nr:hypothetical protein [Burkholderiaceae bacterium]